MIPAGRAGGRWAGYWSAPPPAAELPEASVLAAELGRELRVAIEALPPAQRTVSSCATCRG